MLQALFKINDERTKKVLLVLLALFIIILLIFGAIYFFIAKYMKHQEKKLDNYMYDLCAYRVVNNPKEFKHAVNYYERRFIFKKSVWPLTAFACLTVAVILLAKLVIKCDVADMFTKAFDLIPNAEYETVGKINAILAEAGATERINLPKWCPASIFPTFISKNPDFGNITLWISVVYYLVSIFCFFKVLGAVLGYMARKLRARKMAVEVFNKHLDRLNGGVPTLDNLQSNSVSNQESN